MFRTNLNYLYSTGKLVLKYNRYEITICQRFNNMSKQLIHQQLTHLCETSASTTRGT